MSNGIYHELFKDITPEKWKEICDSCLSSRGLNEYFGVKIPPNVLEYYNRKFGYKCPLSGCAKDERGNKYGRLTVIEYAGRNKNGSIRWKCKCDCGNFVIRDGGWLRESKKKNTNCSCDECFKKDVSNNMRKDVLGQTINFLYVKEEVGRSPWGSILYKCKCLNCGNEIIVSSYVLNKEKGKGQLSCGCLRSKGEYYINNYLQELNIPYKTQYQFPDCRGQLPLRFDFAIFNEDNTIKCLIEFQSRQHYEMSPLFNDTAEKFALRKEFDNIKREYCKEHNLRLIEIPYTKLQKLSPEYLSDLINDTGKNL